MKYLQNSAPPPLTSSPRETVSQLSFRGEAEKSCLCISWKIQDSSLALGMTKWGHFVLRHSLRRGRCKRGLSRVLLSVCGWAGLGLLLCAASPPARTILFLGDSITAGLGVDQSEAYPAIIQDKIAAKGWPFKVINAGVSGDTSAGGLSRLDWVLRNPIDILVLELGANDGLRGLPIESTKKNLQAIIDRTRQRYPQAKIIIAGMKMPPNWGGAYGRQFEKMFSELAKKNKAALIPFVLEGVGGVRNLNQPDAIHPTPEGHKQVAANVWKALEPVIRALQAASS